MPNEENLAESLMRENLGRAVSDVFETMLGRSARLVATGNDGADGAAPPTASTRIPLLVVGTVGFIGEANGLVYLRLEESFAIRCTGYMLGLNESELAEAGVETVNDAVGEITNMVVGNFKTVVTEAGYPCSLTIPSILRGSNFCVEPIGSARRHMYHFECEGHLIVADLLLKSDEA